MRLTSHGLVVDLTEDGTLTIGTEDHPDWFGPGTGPAAATVGTAAPLQHDLGSAQEVVLTDDPAEQDGGDAHPLVGAVRRSVVALDDEALVILRAEALASTSGTATGAFDRPALPWPTFTPAERADGGAPDGLKALAFQHCEFGLPSVADASFNGFFLLPHRPPTGWPLLATAPDGRTILVAPLDQFHDQTIGLNGGTVRCGWPGDLDQIPAGFTTELGVLLAPTAREAIERWGRILLERAGTVRPDPWSDALGATPSYWTDNGAAYWYKTEPGHDVAGSIVAAVEDLRSHDVPIGAVQLDSWFYPHVDLRPFDTDDWVVPPSAMVAWEPREDVLPDGIPALRERLGNPPLVAHIRHLSAEAPLAAEVPVHVDGPYAVPATPEGYERWLDACLEWGIETFEHDWLVEVFFGVKGLRETPGRARAWQEGIDRAAAERGITLQWCMATPADFAQTTTLGQVTSIRTCGDHGYIASAGQLWAWFATTNTLARSLGLAAFKDVFRADPEVAGVNGEPEALLSALSTGPVGLGDRVGRFDPTLAFATCRADGTLIKPDLPIAATSATMLASPAFSPVPMVAETRSTHPSGLTVAYVFVAQCSFSEDRVVTDVPLASLDGSAPTGDVIAWDWRAGTAERLAASDALAVDLGREEWSYHVLAPVSDAGIAVVGDASKFVTAGRPRLELVAADDTSVTVRVQGAGESITVTGWAEASVRTNEGIVTNDADTGIWTVTVDLGDRAEAEVVIAR